MLGRVCDPGVEVKLDDGVWTARPLNDGDVFEPGDSVTVVPKSTAPRRWSSGRGKDRRI